MSRLSVTLSIALALAAGHASAQESTPPYGPSDGAGNPVPRTTGTPGRSGSYSGAGFAGGSAYDGVAQDGGSSRRAYDAVRR